MTLPLGKSRKAVRMRLARAEVLLDLSVTAGRWAEQDTGLSSYAIFERLTAKYDLTEADISKIVIRIADQLETQAERAGYADRWDDPEPVGDDARS